MTARPGTAARLPALLLWLLLTGCGGESAAPSAFLPVPGQPWARVTQAQLEAARAMGVPVARTHGKRRFVYVPAGTFQRRVGGARYEVNLGVGFYVQVAPEGPVTRELARAHAEQATRSDGIWSYRLPTEAEWEYAQRFLPAAPAGREWMLDRFGPLPTWIVSDPHGPAAGDTFVVRDGAAREAVASGAGIDGVAFRLVSPLGYGLGKYGATKVTFRLVDEFAPAGAPAIAGGYDLRVISMNDRLQARTMGVERDWTLVSDPGSPVTLTMVPGAYYVYAEGLRDGQLVRGKEMKFYVKQAPVERTVPVPEQDQERYGSGGREKPR